MCVNSFFSVQSAYMMNKPLLRCPKCSTEFHFEKPRNWVGRNVLFFLPVRKFFCAKCLKDHYLIMTDQELQHYQRV